MANPATNDDFKIATLASGVGGLVTLASLNIPNPLPIWSPGVSAVDLGDNSSRTLGSPTVTWHWGFISAACRDILRAYCPGASADVFITTPTTEKVTGVSNASARYECQMVWPAPTTPESPVAGRRLEFSIVFRQLVVA